MPYLTLDHGYIVEAVTAKAVGLRRGTPPGHPNLVWVPRSVIKDGDDLVKGDRDICVAEWFVNKEGLIT
jgi:hypothetical protein